MPVKAFASHPTQAMPATFLAETYDLGDPWHTPMCGTNGSFEGGAFEGAPRASSGLYHLRVDCAHTAKRRLYTHCETATVHTLRNGDCAHTAAHSLERCGVERPRVCRDARPALLCRP